MIRFTLHYAAFILCMSVMLYSIFVLGGYIFDHVHAYGGPTPMALDTALCLVALSVAGIMTTGVRMLSYSNTDKARRVTRIAG